MRRRARRRQCYIFWVGVQVGDCRPLVVKSTRLLAVSKSASVPALLRIPRSHSHTLIRSLLQLVSYISAALLTSIQCKLNCVRRSDQQAAAYILKHERMILISKCQEWTT